MMKNRLVLFFLSLCLGISVRAQVQAVYLSRDSVKIEKWLHDASRQKASSADPLFFARKMMGVPYVAATLERDGQERLVVNVRQLDCTTFVEQVLALYLTGRSGRTDFATYLQNLEKIRYDGGHLDGYVSRNHYFSGWIESNQKQGIVKEMTGEAARQYYPFTAVQTLSLSYMSTYPYKYRPLKGHPERVRRIREMERRYSGRRVRYIPKKLLQASPESLSCIRNGDILAIVTRKKGLDTSHLGFAVWQDGRLYLMHASSIHKKVTVEPVPLYDYMQKHPSQLGVRVIRIL